MTQKQLRFAKNRPRRVKRAMNDYNSEFRRPTLQSSGDLSKMSAESSRARMISQIVNQPGEDCREFASYYLGAPTNTDPLYSLVSHTDNNIKNKVPVISAYPSIAERLERWRPHRSNSSEDIIATTKERKFTCRCANCTSKCYADTMKYVAFKDNIMTFRDQCTMTPKLRDASCGCTTKASSTSEVAVCVSDVAVRDTCQQLPCRPIYASQKSSPIPILRKTYKDSGITHNRHDLSEDFNGETVRDVCSNINIKPKKIRSIRSLLKLRSRESSTHQISPRITIYNEGISDSIANNLPTNRKIISPPVNVRSRRIKTAVKTPSFTETEVYIPFSHRFDSKYHDNCKRTHSRNFYETDSDDLPEKNLPGPLKGRENMKICRPQCIALPRKVLTSERDIEMCVSKPSPKFHLKSR